MADEHPVPLPPAITIADQAAAVERALREELRMVRKGHQVASLRAALATLRTLAELERDGDG